MWVLTSAIGVSDGKVRVSDGKGGNVEMSKVVVIIVLVVVVVVDDAVVVVIQERAVLSFLKRRQCSKFVAKSKS